MALKVIAVVLSLVILVYPNEIVLSSEDDLGDEVSIFDTIKSNLTSLSLTLPGTKWCGPGDNAEHSEDLGRWENVDECCRDHDNCFDYIESGETKHGLENPDLFTRLHCDCEKEFQNCLKKADSLLAAAIGYTYTIARKNCYLLQYPIKKCSKYQEGYIQDRCITYKLDRNKPKKWQWFDIAFY